MRTKAAPSAKREPAGPASEMRLPLASVLAEPSPNGKPVTSVLAEPSRNGHSASEETIRLCAYRKWEAAGKPVGDGVNFWLEAEREVSEAK